MIYQQATSTRNTRRLLYHLTASHLKQNFRKLIFSSFNAVQLQEQQTYSTEFPYNQNLPASNKWHHLPVSHKTEQWLCDLPARHFYQEIHSGWCIICKQVVEKKLQQIHKRAAPQKKKQQLRCCSSEITVLFRIKKVHSISSSIKYTFTQ